MSRPSCKVLNTVSGVWCSEEACVQISHLHHGSEISTLVCARHAHELTTTLNARGIVARVEPISPELVNQNMVAVEKDGN
jgi:hypothetical protein